MPRSAPPTMNSTYINIDRHRYRFTSEQLPNSAAALPVGVAAPRFVSEGSASGRRLTTVRRYPASGDARARRKALYSVRILS